MENAMENERSSNVCMLFSFTFVIFVNVNKNINKQKISELYLFIKCNHRLAMDRRIFQKSTKASYDILLYTSIGYMEFTMKSVAYFSFICKFYFT